MTAEIVGSTTYQLVQDFEDFFHHQYCDSNNTPLPYACFITGDKVTHRMETGETIYPRIDSENCQPIIHLAAWRCQSNPFVLSYVPKYLLKLRHQVQKCCTTWLDYVSCQHCQTLGAWRRSRIGKNILNTPLIYCNLDPNDRNWQSPWP